MEICISYIWYKKSRNRTLIIINVYSEPITLINSLRLTTKSVTNMYFKALKYDRKKFSEI
jgi:hypothetical protein